MHSCDNTTWVFRSVGGGEAILPMYEELRHCSICPRECGVDRFAGELGWCRSGVDFSIGGLCAHRGEEPVISGLKGIANIFFTHCNLQCEFCQNYQISRNRKHADNSHVELPDLLRRIEAILDSGVGLVGFVSPSHFIPHVRTIMSGLTQLGHNPVWVFNTNSYDKTETIRSLDGEIDVWLPDLKYMDERLAFRYSDCPDYVAFATQAIKEMFRQKGADIKLDDDGLIESGLIIRHLVLPGQVENSKRVLRFIAEQLSTSVHISLMSQYRPTPAVEGHPLLGRSITEAEYDEVLNEFDRLGLHRGWKQDLTSPGNYLPDFVCPHPFEPRRD